MREEECDDDDTQLNHSGSIAPRPFRAPIYRNLSPEFGLKSLN
jgi:hypothetical protein